MHRDQPPHGGVAVSLGEDYTLEFVPDPGEGGLYAYVLDGEMEEFIRIPARSFLATAALGGRILPLEFDAVANPATGETAGHTSCFEARAGWLAKVAPLHVVLGPIEIGGTWFRDIAVDLPGDAGPRSPGPGLLRVVTLSTVLTELATRVGGPAVSVTGLLRPGVDPHTFEPAPADLRKIIDADLILASGLGVESYLNGLAANSGTHARIFEAGSALGGAPLYIEERGRREPDPHWWNSPSATARVTRAIAAEFSALRPSSARDFSARAAAVALGLASLDEWSRAQVSAIPPERRVLVTNHDAFGWFARDYGFVVHPISGLSPDAEPDARELARLSDHIRDEHIRAIFVESSENSGLARTLAGESGAALGGMLYGDGLSPDGDGATYDGMFRHNVRAIVGALTQ